MNVNEKAIGLLNLIAATIPTICFEYNPHMLWGEEIDTGSEMGWVSDEEIERAVEFNTVWCVYWYRDNQPDSFTTVTASRLDVALQAVHDQIIAFAQDRSSQVVRLSDYRTK